MAKSNALEKDRVEAGALAVSGGSQLPAHLANREMTGAGVSSAQDDILIPMATVLQAQSPQVIRQNPNYIEGAAAGDIFMKNAPRPILPGDTGFLFQPCYFDKAVVEWKPRNDGGGGGQGFVARHEMVDGQWPQSLKDDSKEVPDPQNAERKIVVRTSTGNVLVDTRYEAGFVISEDNSAPPMPLVLPFASSGHSVHRAWMMRMNQKMINGKQADSFAAIYRIKTRMRQKGQQTWFVFDITDAGPADATKTPTTMWVPTAEDYERGLALYQGLSKKEIKFGDEAAPAEEGPSADERAEKAGV